MVNRENWLALQAYLTYKREIEHRNGGTIHGLYFKLRYLLEWADATHLAKAGKVKPTYPEYLNTYRRRDVIRKDSKTNTGTQKQLTDNSVTGVMSEATRFLKWAREYVPGMREIEPRWIDTLRPMRRDRPIATERKAVTVEDVRALLAVEWPGLLGRRAKAAAAFLFLSGMRATAFATLPIKAVDIQARSVKQDPAIGVQTKFRKRATTLLLEIPDLLQVVTEWDSEVRQNAGADDLWYFRFYAGPDHEETDRTTHTSQIARDLLELFKRAGLEPMSPHKFRHGHATYALKMIKDMADYKAVSQNLMHANIGITDTIYAILSESDMRSRIEGLGKTAQAATPQAAQPAEAIGADAIAAIVADTVARMMQAQSEQAAQLVTLPAVTKPATAKKATPQGGKKPATKKA